MADSQNIDALRHKIASYGGPDRYIDTDEEADVFRTAESLGIGKPSAEALLNQMCLDGKWTREVHIIQDLYDVLEEATRDDGVIERNEFEHGVNYAVSMNMPRRRAMELCVQYINQHKLAIKKGWFGKNWFDEIRRQYES
jgi:hypothetical protein